MSGLSRMCEYIFGTQYASHKYHKVQAREASSVGRCIDISDLYKSHFTSASLYTCSLDVALLCHPTRIGNDRGVSQQCASSTLRCSAQNRTGAGMVIPLLIKQIHLFSIGKILFNHSVLTPRVGNTRSINVSSLILYSLSLSSNVRMGNMHTTNLTTNGLQNATLPRVRFRQ